MPFLLRPLQAEEFVNFTDICKQTFRETYPGEFSEANLEEMFGANFIKTLSGQLKSEEITYTVACLDGVMIGYAKLIYLKKNILTLDKFYFLKAFQGRGYGKELLTHCCHEAINCNKDIMELIVWEKNESALAFYEGKCGFKRVEEIRLTFAGKIFKDYLLTNQIKEVLRTLQKK